MDDSGQALDLPPNHRGFSYRCGFGGQQLQQLTCPFRLGVRSCSELHAQLLMASAPLPRQYKSSVEGPLAAMKIQVNRIQGIAAFQSAGPVGHAQLNAPCEYETIYLVTHDSGSKETRAAIDRSASARE